MEQGTRSLYPALPNIGSNAQENHPTGSAVASPRDFMPGLQE